MNQELMLRHALEMAIMLPAAFMAFLPVRRHLKLGLLRTFLATGILLILLIFLGAAACVQFQVGTSFVLLPLLLLCMVFPNFMAKPDGPKDADDHGVE